MRKAISFILFLSLIVLSACTPESDGTVGPVQYVETGINPDAWVKVPAGMFYKGQHRHETMIEKPFEIMVTEVTNAQYVKFLNEALAKGAIKLKDDKVLGYYEGEPFDGWKHEFRVPAGDKVYIDLLQPGMVIKYDGSKFYVVQGFENHPVAFVTWFGANAYAKFYGWRLPTENEWEKAARGTDGRSLPWGEEISCAYANYQPCTHLIVELYGRDVTTTPVGFFNGRTYKNGEIKTQNAVSPYGLYDMAGNVWEWTGDDYKNMHYRWLRGGSRNNYEINLFTWRRNSSEPQYISMYFGFRCARDIKEDTTAEAGAENQSNAQ